MTPRRLGVLGGMGPLATADFMRKVIAATPAERDQDHIPMVVYSVPQIPDRSAAILADGVSPLPAMIEGVTSLERAGAQAIAIPCNTAHHWYDDLVKASRVPILHIVDAAARALDARRISTKKLGLLGTTGTIASRVYQNRLEALGYECIAPSAADMDRLVMKGIGEVKAGRLAEAKTLLTAAADTLFARDIGAVILGCTEIPLVLIDPSRYVDATHALAQASVKWAMTEERLARAG
ncbi:MAG: aspartate/glutamate racemase family protein [Rhodospirillales bacterium]|nr:aspartate/glutamate racemase family protein [Rhodospirillales bacterium]